MELSNTKTNGYACPVKITIPRSAAVCAINQEERWSLSFSLRRYILLTITPTSSFVHSSGQAQRWVHLSCAFWFAPLTFDEQSNPVYSETLVTRMFLLVIFFDLFLAMRWKMFDMLPKQGCGDSVFLEELSMPIPCDVCSECWSGHADCGKWWSKRSSIASIDCMLFLSVSATGHYLVHH